MGLTMTQKILKSHIKGYAGDVFPGILIDADLDLVLGNDVTTPVAIKELEKNGLNSVFDKNKIAIVLDHFTPNKDIQAAIHSKICREFANKYDIKHFYDIDTMGIEHALIPEQGLCAPGEIIIGADSHTCTYGAVNAFSTGIGSTDMAYGMYTGKSWFRVPDAIYVNFEGELSHGASGKDVILHIIHQIGVDGARYMSLEFGGEGMKSLSIDDRFTICNMAVEAGAKNGIFEYDEITKEYLAGRVKREYTYYSPDKDAEYKMVLNINLDDIYPKVACPNSPENVYDVKDLYNLNMAPKKVDQVVIGSCTNGRISDLRIAAEVLKGRHIAQGMRLIIIPGTRDIYLQAIKEGLAEIFINAGACFSTPTCGPCLGGHMGVLAPGEVCVSTTNRNFVGRMGDKTSSLYLVSPMIAACTSVAGYITDINGLQNDSLTGNALKEG